MPSHGHHLCSSLRDSGLQDLDIAVVKTTSHVECPPKEKHVKSELLLFSQFTVISIFRNKILNLMYP